jgi:cytochrome c6
MRSKLLCAVVTLVVLSTLPALAAEEAARVDGKDLYAKKCAMCHGANGVANAMGKGSANLGDPEWQGRTSDEAIAKVTLEGKNKMPKFEGKLTPEQVQAIVAHIREMKKAEEKPK